MRYSRRYEWYEANGQVWISVPRAEVEASEAAISTNSYYDPKTDTVFLEEDEDANRFFRCAEINPFDLCFRDRGQLPQGLQPYRPADP